MALSEELKAIGAAACGAGQHHPHNDPSGKVLCCRCRKVVSDVSLSGGPHDDSADAPQVVN